MFPDAPLKIEGLRVRAVRVPLPDPHRTASGVVSESPLVLTDLLVENGIVGHSVVFTYTPIALVPTATLVTNLSPLVAGEWLAPRELERKLNVRFRLLGPQGLVGMALAAVDMAAWDALARVHGVSLVRLLGGVEKPLQAYGAIGYDGVARSGEVAADWASRGFKGAKIKIGYANVREDLAVIRAVRKAMGDEAAVMVDYNQSLTPAEAVQRIRVLDGEGLTWVEEPTLAHDYAGHAHVAREVATPIQCGENWWGPSDLRLALDAGASDFVMPDVMKIGGVSGWLNAATLAGSRGVPVSSHLWPELSAQLLSVTPTAHWLEYADWWNTVIAEPLRIEEGLARPGTAPGSGISWNEEAIARYLV